MYECYHSEIEQILDTGAYKSYAMVQLEDVLAIIDRRIEEAKAAGTIALAAHLLSLKKEIEGRKPDARANA